MSLQRVSQERDALREEDGLERERILHELMEEQQTRVRRKREELRALKRELQFLNAQETDLRRIFAAERTRFSVF